MSSASLFISLGRSTGLAGCVAGGSEHVAAVVWLDCSPASVVLGSAAPVSVGTINCTSKGLLRH